MNISFGTAFWMRFFRFWTSLILNISFLNAETISGFVYHSQSSPVAFAFVKNITKDLIAYSDESGYFDLQGNNEPGDTIQISRIGFHTQTIILSHSLSVQTELIAHTIDLRSVTVQGLHVEQKTQHNELMKISKSPVTKSISPRKIFTSIPGSYLKSYGGSAGVSTLSMDGAPTRHTKILINGFDITNAQNGQVDLSQLPENFISAISYNPYNISAFESGNSEGSVNISPWKEQNSVYMGIGSYGQLNYGISLNYHQSRFGINVLTGKSRDDGNYKGYNPITKKEEKRINNHLEREYVSLKVNGIISESMFARLLYLYSNQNRGVAGQIWSQTPESYRKDYFHLLGAKLGWATKIGAGFFQTTFRNSHDHYFSSAQYGYPYNSEHDVNTIRYKFTQNIKVNSLVKNAVSIQYNDDHLESIETGDHSRGSWIFSNSLAISKENFKVIPAYQYNFSEELYAENTWNYSLAFSPGFRHFHSVNFIQGIFFHYPTFNDLYWKPGGNPNLKPEKTLSISLDIQLSIFHEKDLKLLLFNKSSENLIQWLPSQSYWQPKNVEKSFRRGVKAIYFFSIGNFEGFAHYAYNISEDEYSGKQLLYTPKHSAGLNLDYRWGKGQMHYQVHFIDDRITRYSWPEDIIIDRVIEHIIGVSYDFRFKYGKITNSFLIENITNEQYETIQGYPEPGRLFKYRIQYYITKKGEM